MAIGIVAVPLGIPDKVVAMLMPVLQTLDNNAVASMAAYWLGFFVNMLLTPVAAATALSIPVAEVATNLGVSIKPLLYSFLYGLNQFVLPYELGQALVMLATGFVRIRHIIIVMGLRTLLVTPLVGAMAAFIWPAMGI